MIAVDGIVDVDTFCLLSGAARDDAFLEVDKVRRRLDALVYEMVIAVESSKSYEDDGHRSVKGWVIADLNCTPVTATRIVKTARMLTAMPHLRAAVADGKVGADQLRVFTGLHGNDRCRPQLPDSDEMLTGYAQELTMDEFEVAIRRWEAWADPDGAFKDQDACRENRTASINRVGAGFEFHARGDGVTGEIAADVFNAHVQAEYETDLAVRTERWGDDAPNHPLPRTAAQRRYDAYMTIIAKAAGTNAETDRNPLITILCTPDEFEAAIREWIADTTGTTATGDGPRSSARSRLCETLGGIPIDHATLLEAALIGNVRAAVRGADGRITHLGRSQRFFRGAAREAVLLCGDRCCFPGCTIRGPSIQIDHLTGFTLGGGLTDPLNGGLLCGGHNRDKHNLRISVQRDATGWHYYRADGTEITPRNR